MNKDQFADDYSIESLVKIKPLHDAFEMLVTPRFVSAYNGGYETLSSRLVKAQLASYDLFVDVGAHYGYYSLLAAKSNSVIKIVSVEPVQENVSILRKNLNLNSISQERVTVIEAAISSERGIANIFKSEASDNCSFYPHPATDSLGSIQVKTISLDEIIQSSSAKRIFIKIDTDGHEMEVLKGLSISLDSEKEITIFLEMNPKMMRIAGESYLNLIETLQKSGFSLFAIDDNDNQIYPLGKKTNLDFMMDKYDKSYFNIICLKRKDSYSVTFFSHSSGLGGAERSLLDVVGGLVASGVICNSILPSYGSLAEQLIQSGSGVFVPNKPFELNQGWWWAGKGAAPSNSDLSKMAIRVLSEIVPQVDMLSPDVIYSQTIVSPWGAFSAECLAIPHVLSVREYGRLDHNFKFTYDFDKSIDALYKTSNAIFCITEDVKKELFGSNNSDKVIVVYSGINDLEIYNKSKSQLTLENQGPLISSGFKIGIFSSLQHSKGQIDLVRACIQLANKGLKFTCYIVGYAADVTYENELLALINESGYCDLFFRINYLENPYPFMSQMDIVVSCSVKEALGRSLIEAILMDIPIVYADTGGPNEIYIDHKYGLAYPPGDYQILAKLLSSIIEAPNESIFRIKKAKQYALKRFNKDNYVHKFRSVIAKTIISARNNRYRAKSRQSRHISAFFIGSNEFSIQARLATYVTERDNQIKGLSNSITERDDQILALHFKVGERDSQIERLTTDIQNLNQRITERDDQILALHFKVGERDSQIERLTTDIQNLNQRITERDDQILALHFKVGERDSQIERLTTDIQNLNQRITERDDQNLALHFKVGERDSQIKRLTTDIQNLNQRITERDAEIFWYRKGVEDSRSEIAAILNTNSWRITKPLRFMRKNFFDEPRLSSKRTILRFIRSIWQSIPLSSRHKNLLRSYIKIVLKRGFRGKNIETGTFLDHNILLDSQRLSAGFPHQEFVPITTQPPLMYKPVKLICFYLPQFHEIEENNLWWGKGFTEWTNVKPARPNFIGHYQPHIPGDLGYYNLLDANTQKKQVDLAKLYGIEGFCFYFYWFGGKRLLETPTLNYLSNKELNLPFCLCWANENWSRRWDGLDDHILIKQDHSPGDDIEFISYISKYLKDQRYIRVEGKPLILVYRPSLLPSAKQTARRWRKWCRENGVGEIFIAYTQSFECFDPKKIEFDAAIEFPPNNASPPDLTHFVTPFKDEIFEGVAYDWSIFVERSKSYKDIGYDLFRSVCPLWDNTARRGNKGTVFLNSSPAAYQTWLENAIKNTIKTRESKDKRLVFINAWNEWGEGAHLEPDARYGYAYLNATRNALIKCSETSDNNFHNGKLILVTHDAHPHGAQYLVLNLAKSLIQEFGMNVEIVCLGDGPLLAEYQKLTVVHILGGHDYQNANAKKIVSTLHEKGFRHAIVNTTVSGKFLKELHTQGLSCISLIHELSGVIEQNQLQDHVKAIACYADKIIFPAQEVADSFFQYHQQSKEKDVIRPQGLYKKRSGFNSKEIEREKLRNRYGLRLDAQIILGVGYADFRKGIDIFLDAALKASEKLPDAKWIWVGHWESSMEEMANKFLREHPSVKNNLIFAGKQSNTDLFYDGADIFALTSREDPFPSVVLEAMDASLPIVAFKNAGGFTTLLEGCGELVELGDATAFADAIVSLLQDDDRRRELGVIGADLISKNFSFRHYIFDLLDIVGLKLPRVSVIVPNFNYEQYISERLASIIEQTFPIFEIIFLDDRSDDGSLEVATNILGLSGIDYQIHINEKNSGSPFIQWKKGCDISRGNFIWIAEADDYCSKDFLKNVLVPMEQDSINISYCESRQIDTDGKVIADNYLDYVIDISNKKWNTGYINEGVDEICEALCIKNSIPNVSAVVFRADSIRSVMSECFEEILRFKVAGDWFIYIQILKSGKIRFTNQVLNSHRRHSSGVTLSSDGRELISEIENMQLFIKNNYDLSREKTKIAKDYLEYLAVYLHI